MRRAGWKLCHQSKSFVTHPGHWLVSLASLYIGEKIFVDSAKLRPLVEEVSDFLGSPGNEAMEPKLFGCFFLFTSFPTSSFA